MPRIHQRNESAFKPNPKKPSHRGACFAASVTDLGPARAARRALAVLALVVCPMPVLAQQPDCDSVRLPMRGPVGEMGQRQLAVWIDDEWHPFRSNAEVAAHDLHIGELHGLCMAWEAPPYTAGDKQIVYVSTRHKDGQPLSLFRNSAAAGVPVLWRLFDDWIRPTGRSGRSGRNIFRAFHGDDELETDVTIDDTSRANFSGWHDTSAWFPNTPSRLLVSQAVADTTTVPHGAERLLLLQGARPRTSWVPFGTLAPAAGSELRVAVAYSGDLDTFNALQVDEYVFEIGE